MKKLLLMVLTMMGSLTTVLSYTVTPNPKPVQKKERMQTLSRQNFATCEAYAQALQGQLDQIRARHKSWKNKKHRHGNKWGNRQNVQQKSKESVKDLS